MSIESAIQNAQQKVANAYTAVNNKGGTLPATQDLSNLPTAITSIPTGTTPTGTISITQNGQYNVTNYATADVSVSGGGGGNGKYLVQVIDYDGTVLKSDRLNANDTFTLPLNPSHSGLVFQSWASPVTITNNTVTVTDSDITIGATYTTASGLSEFNITLTTVTGLDVTLNMDGTKNWGDGTSDTATSHTYATTGNYTITCNGITMTTSSSSGLFGQTSSARNYFCTAIRLANVTSIGDYAFRYCASLTSITLPDSVTSMGNSAFQGCSSLTSITIPSGVTSMGDNTFSSCSSLTSITIPSGVTSMGAATFQNCYSLTSIIIPNGVRIIGTFMFSYCASLTSITLPDSVTSMGTYVFSACSSLTSITISNRVPFIESNAFSSCSSLTSITIPSGVRSISSQAFQYCYSNIEYDFSNHTSVPTLSNTNAFTNINGICKIKVPLSLETSWKTASNWSTYADYIVGV